MNFKKPFLLFLILFSCFSFAAKAKAQNASMFLLPESESYSIGDTFSIQVMLDSGGEPVNVAEAVLNFHPGHLEVVHISSNSSVFNFWSTEPSFSNARGVIEFAGGTSKSFLGSSGNIITVTFKALANASTQITFSSGAVLAADGKGTNVLGNMQGGSYELEPGVTIPPSQKGEKPLSIPEGAPSAPTVFSSTHPSEDAWYSSDRVEFSWETPPGITGMRMSLNKSPTAIPEESYPASVTKREFIDLEDGTWYFHIRFRNQYGWGEVNHRRILIDTAPPQTFDINIDYPEGDLTHPKPTLAFESVDTLSGLNYYEVKIGDAESIIIERPEYTPPPHAPGSYTVIVKAIDRARNSITETEEMTIEPLEPPLITDYPETDRVGGALTIEGTSEYPGATVLVSIKSEDQEEPETEEVATDENGNWTFVYDERLQEGIYQVWAKIIDQRGAQSLPTPKVTVVATSPLLLRIGRVAIDYLTVILTLVGLVVGLVMIIFFARYKVAQWRQRLRRETREAALSVVRGFSVLEKKIQDQIEDLDKKPGLSDTEQELYDTLKEALDESKKTIGREIEDVEEELK